MKIVILILITSLACNVQAELPVQRQRGNLGTSASCTYVFTVTGDSHQCPPGDSGNMLAALNQLQQTVALLSQNVLELKNENNALKSLVTNFTRSTGNNNSWGVTYVRWGKSSCPQTAQILYHGYTAKSHYSHGGGVNFLCLPTTPEFLPNVQGGHQSKSYVYGTEYQSQSTPLFPQAKQDHDVPCAVCEVTGRSKQLLLPAKRSCPDGWTMEYEGYLMAQHSSHKGSTFECVDKDLEELSGGATNRNGGLFYVVEANCGSLPCPPYENGFELSCVVCTN